MTDKHDKLVEMALKSGAVNHFVQGLPDRYAFSLGELAAFRSAILADAAKDVQAVAWRFRWNPQGDWHITSHEPRGGDGTNKEPLYSASTLAAAQALNAELVARVAELVAALRTADRTFAENGILASHAARQEIQSALTKGQP